MRWGHTMLGYNNVLHLYTAFQPGLHNSEYMKHQRMTNANCTAENRGMFGNHSVVDPPSYKEFLAFLIPALSTTR